MSNGGGESGKENEQESKKNQGGRDDYGRAIAKIAVAQICENVGFQSFQQSALETLSIVAIRYLRELGKNAHLYANLAGRTDSNVFDVIQGLEDLGLVQGFPGASDVNRCSASSGAVQEIMQYVSSEEEIPFTRPVPHFPVIRSRKLAPSFFQNGQNPDGEHIPSWLPAFPESHTYAHTPTCSERAMDPRTDKVEQVRKQRKVDRPFLSLQQQCNGSVGTFVDPGDVGKAKNAAHSNPYLAPPLRYGEKDVSPVVFPVRVSKEPLVGNRDLVLESSAPAITTENSGFCNSKDGEGKVLPSKRPVVQFKLGGSKKSLGAPLDLTLQNDVGKTVPWFGRDDEKDEKKRKAEQILKESMENPEELARI